MASISARAATDASVYTARYDHDGSRLPHAPDDADQTGPTSVFACHRCRHDDPTPGLWLSEDGTVVPAPPLGRY